MNIKDVLMKQKYELEKAMDKKTLADRDVMQQLSKMADSNLAKIVTGIRRSGKSTLIYLLMHGLDYGYINLDDINLYGIDFNDLFNNFIELYGNVKYIFIDEIQNLDNWELFVNNLQKNFNVFITGSNSKLLSSELSSHLTGRHLQINLFPLSFKEYMEYKGVLNEGYLDPPILRNNLSHYIEMGGFPDILIGKEDRFLYLKQLYTDIIEKDIIIRHKITFVKTFIDMSQAILNNYSGYISYNKIKNVFGIGSVHTARNYIYYLEESFLVFTLDKYSHKSAEIENSVKKIYLMDTGLISILDKSSADSGRSMENAVAIELKRRSVENNFNIYYWQDYNGHEVDFVVKKGIEITSLIQVTYSTTNNEMPAGEAAALVKASEQLNCNNLIIITWDFDDKLMFKNHKIIYISLWRWLLSGNSIA